MSGEMTPQKRTRPDKQVHMTGADNAKLIAHNLEIVQWDSVDMTNPQQVQDRAIKYFRHCMETEVKPTVPGLALAYGVRRETLWKWIEGRESNYIPDETRNVLQKSRALLNALLENYVMEGKLNPVTFIFLMKNHMGYTDQSEHVILHDPMGQQGNADDIAARYQADSVIDITPSDSGDSPAADSGDSGDSE